MSFCIGIGVCIGRVGLIIINLKNFQQQDLTRILLPIVHSDVDGLQAHFLPLDEQVGEVGLAHVVTQHPGVPGYKTIGQNTWKRLLGLLNMFKYMKISDFPIQLTSDER